MENIIIPPGKMNIGTVNIPIFILRLKSCVYEFIRMENYGYLLGRTMVTQQMWEEIMGYNPSDFIGDNIPVNNVSYSQIQDFIAKLTALTSEHCGYKLSYKLMSEQEWKEYSGAQTGVFNDSETIINAGLCSGFSYPTVWCAENSNNKPHEVAQIPPNEYGLYDMYGNLWEICLGCRKSDSEPQRNNFANELAYKRELLKYRLRNEGAVLLKGGAWNMTKENCNKESYMEIGADDKFVNAGFRLKVLISQL